MELLEKQIELEKEITELSKSRYRELFTKSKEEGQFSNTKSAHILMSRVIEDYAQTIKKYLDEIEQGKATRYTVAYKCLSNFDDMKTVAFLTLKAVFDTLHKSPKIHGVVNNIAEILEAEISFNKFKDQNSAYYAQLIDDMNKRNASAAWKYTVLKHKFKEKEEFHLSKWCSREKQHTGLVLVELLLPFGIIEAKYQKINKKTIKSIVPTKQFLDILEGLNSHLEALDPLFLPMVIKPKDWISVYEGGYLSPFIRRCKFIKHYDKGYLRRLEEFAPTSCYDAVNKIQSTPWKINATVFDTALALWTKGLPVAGLPQREDVKMPPHPCLGLRNEDLTDSQKLEAKEWKQRAVYIYRENLRLRSIRLATAQIINIANKFSEYENVYFPHQLDFRGRAYPIPVLLQPQGCDLAKGLLTFSNGKKLDENGVKWLKIHIANTYGMDKTSFENRVKWVDEQENIIKQYAQDPVNFTEWSKADKPFQFLAACMEYNNYLKDPENFISTLPVSVDGSNNGLQHYSALIKDEIAGGYVNLINNDTPSDIYEEIAKKLQEEVKKSSDIDFAQKWLEIGINRKLTKRPVMTLPYSATSRSRQEYIKDYLIENYDIDYLHNHFSKTGNTPMRTIFKASFWLERHLWTVIGKCLPATIACMEYLKTIARITTKHKKAIEWVTPLGLLVNQANYLTARAEVRTEVAGKAKYLNLQKNSMELSIKKQENGICPNIIHSLDASALMLFVLRCEDSGINNFALVHDSYGTLAADMEAAQKIIKESFVELYGSFDVLEKLVDDVVCELSQEQKAELPKPPEYGTLDIGCVLESRYFFN